MTQLTMDRRWQKLSLVVCLWMLNVVLPTNAEIRPVNLIQYQRSRGSRRPLLNYTTLAPPINSILASRAPNGTLVPYVVSEGSTKGPPREETQGPPTRGKRDNTDRIYFPHDMESFKPADLIVMGKGHWKRLPPSMRFGTNNSRFVPKGCGSGSTICVSAVDYPADYVDEIVARIPKQYLGAAEDVVMDIAERVSFPDVEQLCQSKESVVYPKIGQTNDDTWAYIINHANFSQAVRVEQCLNEGHVCAFTDGFPYGYTTECKQKYHYRHLYALNDRGEIVKDTFRLPGCCQCVVHSTFGNGISSRLAHPSANETTVVATTTSPRNSR